MHDGTHDVERDTFQIPVSSGIPKMVRVAFIIGIIVVFIIVGLVIGNSEAGHVWPSTDSMKIKL